MAELDYQQKKVVTTKEMLDTEIIVNMALIDILIDKHIISEEELVNYIGKIRLEQVERLNDSHN